MMNFECWIDFATLTAVNDPVRVTKSIARGFDSLSMKSFVPIGLWTKLNENHSLLPL